MFYTIITEIWDALQAAAEAELTLAQVIVESAGVIVTSSDMTTCYDERGINIYSITILNSTFFKIIIYHYKKNFN